MVFGAGQLNSASAFYPDGIFGFIKELDFLFISKEKYLLSLKETFPKRGFWHLKQHS